MLSWEKTHVSFTCKRQEAQQPANSLVPHHFQLQRPDCHKTQCCHETEKRIRSLTVVLTWVSGRTWWTGEDLLRWPARRDYYGGQHCWLLTRPITVLGLRLRPLGEWGDSGRIAHWSFKALSGFVFNLLRTTKKVNMNYDLPEDTDEIFLRRVIHGTVLAAFFIWLQDNEDHQSICTL